MPKRTSKPDLTVAFAGTGSTNVEKKNVEALLDDFVKGRTFFALIPDPGPKRGEKGLRNVWSWLDENEHQYDQEKITDFVAKLKGYRDEGDEVLLVLAWDDEDPTEPIELLMNEAIEADIPVKDLCRALDDLEFDESGGEDATEEEEDLSEPVTTPPKRGKARQQGRSKSPAKPSAAKEEAAEVDPPWDTSDAPKTMNVEAALEALLHPFMLKHYGLSPQAAPKISVFYNDSEDSYRLVPGKGRPRRGEERKEITHEEALKLKLIEE